MDGYSTELATSDLSSEPFSRDSSQVILDQVTGLSTYFPESFTIDKAHVEVAISEDVIDGYGSHRRSLNPTLFET